MIGILGPSINYSSSGVDLRYAMRRFAGWRAFCVLLYDYVFGWRRLRVETYRVRKGIVWEAKKGTGDAQGLQRGQGSRPARPAEGSRRARSAEGARRARSAEGARPARRVMNGDGRNGLTDEDGDGMERLEDDAGRNSPLDDPAEQPEHDQVQSPEDNPITDGQATTSSSDELSPVTHDLSPPESDPPIDDSISTSPNIDPATDGNAPASSSNEYSPVAHDLSPPPSPESDPPIDDSISTSSDASSSRFPSPGHTASQQEFLPSPTQPPAAAVAPIRSLSLVELTAHLLMARQRGRLTEFRTLWDLIPVDNDTYQVSFDGRRIEGITLKELVSEGVDGKLCIFGCMKYGKHQWISSTE